MFQVILVKTQYCGTKWHKTISLPAIFLDSSLMDHSCDVIRWDEEQFQEQCWSGDPVHLMKAGWNRC